jgi:hypothetical protein
MPAEHDHPHDHDHTHDHEHSTLGENDLRVRALETLLTQKGLSGPRRRGPHHRDLRGACGPAQRRQSGGPRLG